MKDHIWALRAPNPDQAKELVPVGFLRRTYMNEINNNCVVNVVPQNHNVFLGTSDGLLGQEWSWLCFPIMAVDTLAYEGVCWLPMLPADGTGSGQAGEQELSAWPGGQAMTQECASELLTCQGLLNQFCLSHGGLG